MASSIRVKASISGDVATLKALIKHPMETGQRKDSKTGELIPAKFIQEVICTHNGSNVMTAEWGAAVSKNPYLSFKFKGASKGDKITLKWIDNTGETDETTASVG